MYAIIRYIVFAILSFIFIIILKKCNKLKKKTLIISVIVTVIMAEISMIIPIENQFIHFKSVDSAYNYTNTYKVKYIIDGKNSDLVVGYNKIDTDNFLIVPKDENGWQVGLGKDIELAIAASDNCSLSISSYKPTNEYYIFVYNSNNEELKIKDNHNSVFKQTHNLVIDNINSYEYAAYVGEIDNGYRLTVNDKTYKLIKSDKNDKLYEMQLIEE